MDQKIKVKIYKQNQNTHVQDIQKKILVDRYRAYALGAILWQSGQFVDFHILPQHGMENFCLIDKISHPKISKSPLVPTTNLNSS